MKIVEAKKSSWKLETLTATITVRYSKDSDTWRITVHDGERVKMQAYRRTFQEALMRAWDWCEQGH